MDQLTIREITDASEGTLLSGDESKSIRNICTDSRAAKEDSLFIPLIGENHDAHDFIPGAYEQGCRAFLVSKEEAAPKDAAVVLVDDTLKAMQRIARYYLDKIDVRRIAVTGSVGKTTTRDMLYYILSEKYRTGRPEKNYNNLVGVPLTVFQMDGRIEAVVFEEGMDRLGMIHDETWITRPEVGIITNVGISHMERLGSRENIRKAKLEITDFFDEKNTLVINASNDMLAEYKFPGTYKVVRVGFGDDSDPSSESGKDSRKKAEKSASSKAPAFDYIVTDVKEHGIDGISFTLTHGEEMQEVRLLVPGAHNAMNAALAIAGAEAFCGISTEEAVRGLSKLDLTGKRLKVRKANGITVIDDSYNAAPESMKSAIRTLEATEASRRVAVFGGMNELGQDSETRHYEIGRFAAEHGVSLVISVGSKARAIYEGARDAGCSAKWYPSNLCLFEELDSMIRRGDVILTKGSNATRMDLVADQLLRTGVRYAGK